MVLCAQFPLSEKKIVWPFDPTPWVKGVYVGKIFATMLLPASSAFIWYATWLLSEKDSLTFRPHPLGRGCVCGQNICNHVDASIVIFNLICYMTIFWKSLILASAPPPKSTQGARTKAFKLKSRLICFIFIAALSACKISAKILIIALVIAKFKYLTFDPLGRVKGGGVKLWHCHSYLQALGNHGL